MKEYKSKIIQFHKPGGPDVLKSDEIIIDKLQPHEVLVNVKAAGINRIDTLFRMGVVMPPKYPSKIGYEGSGIIVTVGDQVKNLKEGDEVSIIPAFSNDDYGTYGEMVLMPEYALQPKSKQLSFEEAASLWTSYFVAYGMIVDQGKLQNGQYVIINAASSSVGLAAIQITNMLGGIPIALTTSENKKERLIEYGAKHVIVTKEENIPNQVMKITENKGAHIILDAVGGAQFNDLLQSSAQRGIIFAYGVLSNGQKGEYDASTVAFNMLTIIGYNSEDLVSDSNKRAKAIDFITEGVNKGDLKPIVSKTFKLEDVQEAHQYMESNQQFGKVVLVN